MRRRMNSFGVGLKSGTLRGRARDCSAREDHPMVALG